MEDANPLSDREMEVLKLVATGVTNQEIARALSISPNTVKVHLRNTFDKLAVGSRTEATMEAVRRGWVTVPASDEIPVDAEILADSLRGTYSPIARWQRTYMIGIAVLIALIAVAPGMWRGRTGVPEPTPFSDLGHLQAVPQQRSTVGRWSSRALLAEPRSRMAVVADSSYIYAIGGETAGGVTSQLTRFDPERNSWLEGDRKPTAVSNVAAAILSDLVYVPGGTTESGAVTNALEVYDPRADSWAAAAPLPVPVAAYGLAAAGGKMFLFGGWDGQAYQSATWIYDPAIDSWTQGTQLTSARALLAASALEGIVYVVGGFDGVTELDTVAVYDPAAEGTAGGPWSLRAPLNQPRAGLAMTALGPRLYVVGGGLRAALAYNEQFETQTGAWSRIATPYVREWRNLGLAAQGQNLYAVGGWSGGYLSANEEYVALVRQLLPLSSKGS